MSSFTKPLTVTKLPSGLWKTARAFTYYVGQENSDDFVLVPKGFKTDFASIPRPLWSLLPPDGEYTQAAVLHDRLYFTKERDRKESDDIFLESMEVLEVPTWKAFLIYKSVRLFGWIPWGKRGNTIKKTKKRN